MQLDEAKLRNQLHLQESVPVQLFSIFMHHGPFAAIPFCENQSLMQHENGRRQSHIIIEE